MVHEWGTFTSVQSSDGYYLEGLHHEEEALPSFVHRYNYMGVKDPALTKGMGYLPEPVTQKMETPVIYFYTPEPKTVNVSVDFPEGIFSEWYPHFKQRQASFTPYRVENGGMNWQVDLTNESQPLPNVAEDDIWMPSRLVPDAAYVSLDLQYRPDEHEKFIFYRGLGTFEPPFRSTHDGDGYEFANLSAQDIPAVYFLEVKEDQGHIIELGDINGFDSIEFSPTPDESPGSLPIDQMVPDAQSIIAEGLIETGLTKDEAQAMVDTWEDSYFRTPGTRVLYILPDLWTDDLLPMTVDPEPDVINRTLMGRVEVLSQQDEQATVDLVVDAYNTNDESLLFDAAHHFSEPRVRRACQLIDDAATKDWCDQRAEDLQGDFRVSTTW